jgi:hypothetical protein
MNFLANEKEGILQAGAIYKHRDRMIDPSGEKEE